MELSKAKPQVVFSLLEAASALGPCSIEQIRGHLKAQWPPVRSARTFAEQYGLVQSDSGMVVVTSLGRRLLLYTDAKRVEFVLRHWRLQDSEPFLYLRGQLASRGVGVKPPDLADIVRTKFLPNTKWNPDDRKGYGEALCAWMEFMRLVEKKEGEVRYVGGAVVTPSVFSLLEVEFLKTRELRDWFVESFDSPRAIVDDCRAIHDAVGKETDDDKRGRLFHRFIFEAARRLGFSPRTRNSPYESDQKVSFEESKGGGDLALFFHHPVESAQHTFQGGALACEAKSTESNVGSKAVGQARNLAAKLREAFPEYIVMPMVVSRSKLGFDPSGMDLAPPEVFHFSAECVLTLLDVQRERFTGRNPLLLPTHVFQILDALMKTEHLQPTPDEVRTLLATLPGMEAGPEKKQP